MKYEISAELSKGLATIEIEGKKQDFKSEDENELRRLIVQRTSEYAVEINASYVVLNTLDSEGEDRFGVTPDGKIVQVPTGDDAEEKAAEPLADSSGAAPVDNAYEAKEAATEAKEAAAPTVADFLTTAPPVAEGPAEEGWRGAVAQLTGLKISPSKVELRHREAKREVQRSHGEPKTIVVLNPKGGTEKTTTCLSLGEVFGTLRGGSVLTWDVNETRGTLGWRAPMPGHDRTSVDLLNNLEHFDGSGRVGDLDRYVRSQGDARFDVLASDEKPGGEFMIGGTEFNSLHSMLQKYYRLIVVDTGNNMRASNWRAAVEKADQIVIVSPVREDAAASAAWLIDGLRELGYANKIANAVTIIRTPDPGVEKDKYKQLQRRLRGHFEALTREVVEVPFDKTLASGERMNFSAVSKETKEAWLYVAEAISKGL
ncbi:MinD/ParA family ATP-binding protein [Glutamicibacter sp. MCAF14]|uniref:MinD/ParA family ATP-binding protein n=1 Tax=Glutamicibacter sp. MCAF14 TaxID=3233043 RepID=UPI003F8EBF1E